MTRFDRIRRSLHAELESYPGRAAGTLQDTLSMVVALVLADTLRVPGMALALALILLLQRESPGITFRNIMQIFGGAVAACITCLAWAQLTDGVEVFRFLGIVFCVFFASFCMASTRLPLFFTIFGFYGFVDLAGWDTHRTPHAIVTTMLYNVASLGIALGVAGLVNFLFASRHPGEELQNELTQRIRLLASFYRELASPARRDTITDLHHRVVQYAHAGDLKLSELYEELRSTGPADLPPGLRFRIGLLTSVLEHSSVLGFMSSFACNVPLRIAALCDHILDARLPMPAVPEPDIPAPFREIFTELSRYNQVVNDTRIESVSAPQLDKREPMSFSLFHSDAFTTPDAVLYALKLTLCAVVCYILYTAIAWPGILTCVVTVLFTGLSSTGAMKQKQLYRLVGAVIGGVLAILVESLLFPNMDSITALILVAGSVCMLSAWVSRSPRIGYVGVQIAFAFFLTDLSGFGAASQIAPARDRVIGIGLGVLVMWFVFDQVWPTRPSAALLAIKHRMLHNTNRSSGSMDPRAFADVRAEVSADLAQMQALAHSALFDFSTDQHRELARSRRLTREITAAAAIYYNNLHKQNASK